MKTTHARSSKCPDCGYELNAATGMFSDAPPSPGDVTMCAECGCMLIYMDDMRLRTPNDDELQQLAGK